MNQCIVCLEEEMVGVRCDFNHLLCRQCIAPYIKSVTEDMGKLKDQGFTIRCPVMESGLQCKSAPWSCSTLSTMVAESNSLDQYVDTLVSVCKSGAVNNNKAMVSKEEVVPLLLDALNLRCPNPTCGVALDPSPDGCCAIRCCSCAVHACFLCFQTCADSVACHQHVRECPCSPKPDNLFISEKDRIPALRRIRVMALRRVLAKAVLADTTQAKNSTDVEAAVVSNAIGNKLGRNVQAKKFLGSIKRELSDLHITADHVFNLDVKVASRAGLKRGGGAGVFPAGPVLQDARPLEVLGAHLRQRAQRIVFFVVLAMILFFLLLVYAINLLASLSNRHKLENGEAPYGRAPPDTSPSTSSGDWPSWNDLPGGVSDYLISPQRVVDIASGLECLDCEAAELGIWGMVSGNFVFSFGVTCVLLLMMLYFMRNIPV